MSVEKTVPLFARGGRWSNGKTEKERFFSSLGQSGSVDSAVSSKWLPEADFPVSRVR